MRKPANSATRTWIFWNAQGQEINGDLHQAEKSFIDRDTGGVDMGSDGVCRRLRGLVSAGGGCMLRWRIR